MRKYCLLIAFTLFCGNILAQNPNVAQIRQQMANIRQSTDWNNPEAAKKANEKIRELSKQLMTGGQASNPTFAGQDSTQQQQAVEGAEYRMKLWDQIWTVAKTGENANIDLAKPLREEIKKEYEDDESRKIGNPLYLDEMTYLCIDMSSPVIGEVIEQMENYKSIKTLVITGGKNGAPVDLLFLLSKAKNYPLQTLYIINFQNFVTTIPDAVAGFQQLKLLGLYNNSITQLPSKINSLANLEKLYIDMNPVSVVTPEINQLINLDSLGIVKTKINDDELKQIAQYLPNCKIFKE